MKIYSNPKNGLETGFGKEETKLVLKITPFTAQLHLFSAGVGGVGTKCFQFINQGDGCTISGISPSLLPKCKREGK
jgi:hypothetical protein